MTVLLTDNMPLLVGAPNGIKKLRELILELAVRGKLVPQDSSDEPASELLKQIAEDKARLVAEGWIKKQKPLQELAQQGQSMDLPVGWVLSRLGEIVNISTGKLDANAAVSGGMYPFFTCSQTPSCINSYSYDTAAVLLAGNGDFNLKKFEGRFEAYQRTYVIEPLLWDLDFCFISVSAEIEKITENNRGSAIPYLKLGDITNPVVWVPPLAEQRRIVAKVDELMALCDRLEVQNTDAQSAHAQLVKVLLDSLTESHVTELSTNWQRLAENFHALFTTESSIDALKQTLLKLAVMGKLVPQVLNDEPASKFLARISEEKFRLVSEGVIKRHKPSAEITEAEKSFELPENWEWIRLEEIAHVGTGATPLRTNPKYFEPATISWVTSGETSQDFIRDTEQKVSPLALAETNLTVYPPHTLIIAMYGQGKTRGQISELLIDACTNQACAAIQLLDQDESFRRYVKYFFVKSYDEIRLLAAGGAQPNLNLGKIKETLIPLPPKAEQQRIVVKVDQLMAFCDQLKIHLAQARLLNEQLADTLLEQSVA